MRSFQFIIIPLIAIAFAGYSQGKKHIQKFKLPEKTISTDYESGVVWVKLKDKHRAIFETSTSGRAKINIQSAQPLVNPKSVAIAQQGAAQEN